MNCSHLNLKTVPTPETIHHGKEICADCGCFIRWLPKPETLLREKSNHETIAKLKVLKLTEWENGFILSLEKQGRHFSPKQQATLEKIASERLNG